MRILCTNQGLTTRGGTESYLQTIAPALRQLGHDVEFVTPKLGAVAERFRSEQFVVHEDVEGLEDTYDVVHAQHASMALAVRAELATVPLVFVSHSWVLDIEDPPPGANPAALVALNDIVERRARASSLAERVPVHRLTQPVTISAADKGRIGIRPRPIRAVAISRNLSSRIAALGEACAEVGIELDVIGRDDEDVEDSTTPIVRADLVFGSGRTILEALALGRAAFVYDETGCAGFVTPDSYGRLEACGFTPEVGSPVRDLPAQLSTYDSSLGMVGRELVVRHHTPAQHAAALVAIYKAAGASPRHSPPPETLRRLAVVTQQAYEAEFLARARLWQVEGTARRLDETRRQLDEANGRLAAVQSELDAVRRTVSWRLSAPLRAARRGIQPLAHRLRAPSRPYGKS